MLYAAKLSICFLSLLAREKKGEFLDVFADMQARGYVRFRVNGELLEFDNLPKLKKTEKHDIDVVVDRLRVREDIKQRLAESFEAALLIADGRALLLRTLESNTDQNTSISTTNNNSKLLQQNIGNIPNNSEEIWFNAKFACPVCNYSIAELEPRLFSFNSPVGACPCCGRPGKARTKPAYFCSSVQIAF